MHILVIGGTGMLAEASALLAARCTTLTMIARSVSSLSRFDQSLDAAHCHRHLIRLDWSDPADFFTAISQHVMSVGIPKLVVAWVHDETLAMRLAELFAPHRACTDFFHVRSSQAGAPGGIPKPSRIPKATSDGMQYREIILGFQLESRGARWLTHSEISRGVVHAIDNLERMSIVGTLQPWSSRP